MRDKNFVISEETNGYYGGESQIVPYPMRSEAKTLFTAIHLALSAHKYTGYRFNIYRFERQENDSERNEILSHDDIVAGYQMFGKEI